MDEQKLLQEAVTDLADQWAWEYYRLKRMEARLMALIDVSEADYQESLKSLSEEHLVGYKNFLGLLYSVRDDEPPSSSKQ